MVNTAPLCSTQTAVTWTKSSAKSQSFLHRTGVPSRPMSRQAFLQLRILESCRAAAVPAGLIQKHTQTDRDKADEHWGTLSISRPEIL